MKICPCIASLLLAGGALAAPPHEHGTARLDVAVERQRVTLALTLPLDAAFGFERAPRTDAERQKVQAALALLGDTAALFRVDPAAQCTPAKADLPEPAWNGQDGHADIDAGYEFSCKDGARAGFVEVRLFEALPRLQRVDVQAVTGRGQLKATLKRPTTRLPLAR